MKRIAVGIDFSEADQRLLDRIAPLAKSFGASVALIHIMKPWTQWGEYAMISVMRDPQDHERERHAREERLGEIAQALHQSGVQADIHLGEGDLALSLLVVAEKEHCDLIAVGTHSRTMLGRAFLGHVADRVVRKASVPVLVVPTAGEPTD